MDSAAVIAGLPYVFGTSEFRAAYGVTPSAASRALRAAADKHIVSRLGRGLWQRLDSAPPQTATHVRGPVAIHWTPTLEALLQARLGSTPRRLSHLAALGMNGVPLMCGTDLAVPHGSTAGLDRFGITVYREPETKLVEFATQVTDDTWVSSTTRAALESAHAGRRGPRWDERVAWALTEGPDVLDVEEAAEIADALHMRAGFRRVASIAAGFVLCDVEGLNLDLLDDRWVDAARAQRGDKWISFEVTNPEFDDRRTVKWEDRRHKVRWHTDPAWLAASLLT